MKAAKSLKTTSAPRLSSVARNVLLACTLGSAALAHAGGTISLGDDKSISLGLGLKTSYTSTENAAPDGSRSSDFNVDSARLYISASLNKYVKATLNTEKDGSDNVKILDAFGAVNFMPEFNVQFGRTIVPSDRANLSGGYFLPAWDFAGVGSKAFSKFASRDDGVLAWGKLMGSKVVYSAGIFQGRNNGTAGSSNVSDSMLYAGRVAINFLDPEPAPAYLTGSTYYGSANILTLGIWGHSQKNGIGTSATKDDYKAWGTDLLFETKLPAGVITLEGGYSKYDWSQAAATADATINTTGAINAPGKSMIAGAAFMFPQQVGWGKFQPFYRYQKFDPDTGSEVKRNDIGVNYLIDGANARITGTYRTDKTGAAATVDSIIVGLQLNF